jgi:beta-galactosidase/beta-glucuronidase
MQAFSMPLPGSLLTSLSLALLVLQAACGTASRRNDDATGGRAVDNSAESGGTGGNADITVAGSAGSAGRGADIAIAGSKGIAGQPGDLGPSTCVLFSPNRATFSQSAVPSKAIDTDLAYPDQTEVFYLSGKGTDDAVDWAFAINTGDKSGTWASLPVPSNWDLCGFGWIQYGFNASTEVGTYRRSFELPATFSGRRIFVVFEGSMTDTSVSINGTSAGPTHQGGFYRFRYDVTNLLAAGTNQIEVVVAEQSADTSVNAAEREADYWTFGGIYRPVYLQAHPQESIDRVAIDARADGALNLDVRLLNLAHPAQLTARVFDENMAPVGTAFSVAVEPIATQVKMASNFAGVTPWSAERPQRYRLSVELEIPGGGRHAIRENFGFRSIEVRPGDGIYVNGTRVILRGANRHSFWPESGRALNATLTLADASMLKDMNMNAVRCSHYPPDKHFLDAADALGLYVLDELAGWQSPPYDTSMGRKLIEEMVTFDVNHPSIIFWDNGNEGGWNTALDADFAIWDPQGRAVLHPWATFSSINTDHYESYASTTNILKGSTLFMPTEFLHGLYDGGAGAGLDDYWNATLASPRGAGGFLWAYLDEGVQRTPTQIDTAGNAAPDGIVGPYREKEGSYYAIRQIWSPVQIAMTALSADFSGSIEVENRYDETNLDGVLFKWQLVQFDFHDTDGGHVVQSEGTARTGSIMAHAKGTLALSLPTNWNESHALLLDAEDATGRLIGKWSWMVATPSQLRSSVVPTTSSAAAVAVDDTTQVTVSAAGTSYRFSKSNGTLTSVIRDGKTFALRNGPTLSAGTATLTSFAAVQSGNDVSISAQYTGDLQQVEWLVLGNGWLRLSYQYSMNGSYDYYGVDFDCPVAQVQGAEWLGLGPSRVWKNRMRGNWHDLWYRAKNDAITGQRWDYPEFKGYFAEVAWARLTTTEGPIDIMMDSPGMFLRLFTPTNGSNAQAAVMTFPAHEISFLQGIAPIGDKFLAPANLGPQGQQHQLNGAYQATIYFRFGQSDG